MNKTFFLLFFTCIHLQSVFAFNKAMPSSRSVKHPDRNHVVPLSDLEIKSTELLNYGQKHRKSNPEEANDAIEEAIKLCASGDFWTSRGLPEAFDPNDLNIAKALHEISNIKS